MSDAGIILISIFVTILIIYAWHSILIGSAIFIFKNLRIVKKPTPESPNVPEEH